MLRSSLSQTIALPVSSSKGKAISLNTYFMNRLFTMFVFIIDVIGLGLAFAFISSWRLNHFEITDFLSPPYFIVFMTVFLIFYVFDLYRLESQILGLKAPGRVIVAVLLSGLCIISLIYLLAGGHKLGNATGRTVLIGALSTFIVWAAVWRMALTHWMRGRVAKLHWLVLGKANTLQKLWKDFNKTNNQGRLHALLPDEVPEGSFSFSVLGRWEECDHWLNRNWAGVIIGEDTQLPNSVLKSLMKSRLAGLKVFDLAEFYERIWCKVPIFYLQDGWFTKVHGFELLHNPIGLRMKQIFDIVLSIFLLILTAPVMLITTLAVYLTSRGPVIYTQVRVGEGGRKFVMYKFRSMIIDAEKNGAQWATTNDNRITLIGKIIRLMRIDELPQLINVLKGDMSFIGPRPERPEIIKDLKGEVPYYDLRHLVKPGITGWAQVLYKYGSSVEDAREKLQYDLFYIKNYSLLLDFAIILKTIRTVLSIKGR